MSDIDESVPNLSWIVIWSITYEIGHPLLDYLTTNKVVPDVGNNLFIHVDILADTAREEKKWQEWCL